MTSRPTIILTGIISFLILSSGFALAKGAHFGKGTCLSYVDRIPGITLDDAQRKALESKDAEFKKKMIQLRADHAVARVDKDEALKSKAFKKGDVQKQIRKMMDIEIEMEMIRLDAMDELRTVLTDEQWETFTSHMGPGKYKGKACPRMGNAADCPRMGNAADCPKGKGMGMGTGTGHHGGGAYGNGMQNCPYSGQTTTN